MKAGQRDRLITIERDSGTSENSFGEVTASWATYATAWAQIVYGTGGERRDSAIEGADQPATFRILADTTNLAITTADRIAYDGYNWDIVNVSPLMRDGIELTAIRRASQ